MTWHLFWLGALCVAIICCAISVYRCLKQIKVLDKAIQDAEQILAFYGARGRKSSIKLESSRIPNHLRRSFVKGKDQGWRLETEQAVWCDENLSGLPKIIGLKDHYSEIYLSFATDDDAMFFKIRWF